MPGQFDTTTTYLVEKYPTDWLSFLNLSSSASVAVINANLLAVSAEVDKVVRVDDSQPWIAHPEFQTSYDPTMGRRLVRYSAMLHLQHEIPVASVLVVLRPEADGRRINGEYHVSLPDSNPYLTFTYTVWRLWRQPARELPDGPLGILPLAPLGATRRAPASSPVWLGSTWPPGRRHSGEARRNHRRRRAVRAGPATDGRVELGRAAEHDRRVTTGESCRARTTLTRLTCHLDECQPVKHLGVDWVQRALASEHTRDLLAVSTSPRHG